MPCSNSHRKTITHPKHLGSGEPDDAKVSSPVRRGVCGKVSARITRYIPTLLHTLAKCPTCVAVGADPTGQGDLLSLQLGDGSDSPGTHGKEDEGCAARLWR